MRRARSSHASAGPPPADSVFDADVKRNSKALTIAHLSTRLLRFPALLALAPFLGRESFGRFVAAGALLEIVRLLHNFGSDEIVSRRVATVPGRLATVLPRLLGLRLILSGLAFVVAAISGALFIPGELGLVLIGACEFPIRAALEGLYLPFRVRLQMHRVLGVAISQTAAFVIGCLAAVILQWPLTAIMAIGPLSALVGAIHIGAIAAGQGWLRLPQFSMRWSRGILLQSWPIGVTALLVLAYFRVDTLMLKSLVGDAATGDYGLAFRCSETLLILAGALATTFYPLLSARAREPERFRQIFLEVQPVIARLAIGSAFVLATVGARPLERLFADTTSLAAPLWLLAWATACMFFNQFSAPALIALGAQARVTRIAGTNLVLNVALNAWWIPMWGVAGACAATLATEATNAVCQQWVLSRSIGPWPWFRQASCGLVWPAASLPVAWLANESGWGWLVALGVSAGVGFPALRELFRLWRQRDPLPTEKTSKAEKRPAPRLDRHPPIDRKPIESTRSHTS